MRSARARSLVTVGSGTDVRHDGLAVEAGDDDRGGQAIMRLQWLRPV